MDYSEINEHVPGLPENLGPYFWGDVLKSVLQHPPRIDFDGVWWESDYDGRFSKKVKFLTFDQVITAVKSELNLRLSGIEHPLDRKRILDEFVRETGLETAHIEAENKVEISQDFADVFVDGQGNSVPRNKANPRIVAGRDRQAERWREHYRLISAVDYIVSRFYSPRPSVRDANENVEAVSQPTTYKKPGTGTKYIKYAKAYCDYRRIEPDPGYAKAKRRVAKQFNISEKTVERALNNNTVYIDKFKFENKA